MSSSLDSPQRIQHENYDPAFMPSKANPVRAVFAPGQFISGPLPSCSAIFNRAKKYLGQFQLGPNVLWQFLLGQCVRPVFFPHNAPMEERSAHVHGLLRSGIIH